MRKPEPVAPPRLPVALRAAVSTAIPVLVGVAAGDLGAGLIATLGAFTSRFGVGRPYLSRAVQLAVVALALALAVAAGSWAADVAWAGVLTVSTVAVIAVWLCSALRVGPPGAYVFVVACAAGIGVSASRLEPWQIGGLVLAGGTIAWAVQMVGAVTGFRRPERASVQAAGERVAGYLDAIGGPAEESSRRQAAHALHQAWTALIDQQPAASASHELQRLRATTHAVHVLFARADADTADVARALGRLDADPDAVAHRDPGQPAPAPVPAWRLLRDALRTGSQTRLVMVRVAIGVPLAGFAAVGLGIDRAYWAMAAAVLILHQGAPLWHAMRRGAERLAGTWIGLALAAAIIAIHPQGWLLAAVLALLNFAIEMLVVRNYLLASVFITSTALTIGTASHPLAPGQVGHLLLTRGVDTLIGCAIGLAVYLALARRQETQRLADALTTTRAALALAEPFAAAGDAESLSARTARRDLQRAALDMLDVLEAAEAGPREQREAAERLRPDVLAVERASSQTIAALWI
ncbi:FUSC family protein [Mycolicibacterium obuense]|uniref:FUSC family protein n=1 Tax=Mycolicibacterium obuense TaxID=1807 RepID=A0A0J6VT20_9MYCO|nr:FUSC family protein [Mycolicibacterium obuense]KMO72618.1 Fusaric acid resistance protein family protein [Mycolicibacterium obuense]TDL12238.1 FUSC family protein [Mycolicibacterium obuense]